MQYFLFLEVRFSRCSSGALVVRFEQHLVACLICAQQVLTRWRRLGHQVHIGAAHAEAWLLSHFGVRGGVHTEPIHNFTIFMFTPYSCFAEDHCAAQCRIQWPDPTAWNFMKLRCTVCRISQAWITTLKCVKVSWLMLHRGLTCTAKSWRKDACLMLNCGDSHGATVLRMSGGACLHLLRLEWGCFTSFPDCIQLIYCIYMYL